MTQQHRPKPGSEHYFWELDAGGEIPPLAAWEREETITDMMRRHGWDRARAEAVQDDTGEDA